MRIGIAGAGLVGRLLAFELAERGHEVIVHDPAAGPQPPRPSGPRAAAWTAAGMLSPLAELDSGDERLVRWGLRSLQRWQAMLPRLSKPVHFRREGSLLLAHRDDLGTARRLLARMAARTQGQLFGIETLDGQRLAALEPQVHGPAHAWWLRSEGHIHPVEAMQALAASATARGVRWRWNCPIARVEPGRLWPAAGVGAEPFDLAVDARGVGARPQCPVRGVRGEVFWLHAPGVTLHRPLRLLHPRWRVYLVPRPGDLVVVGASEIESEDLSPASVRSTLGLLSAAYSVVPALAEARLVRCEVNLRPALPDNLPLLQVEPGLVRLNGLFRHGWLLAPALVEEALQRAGLAEPLAAEREVA